MKTELQSFTESTPHLQWASPELCSAREVCMEAKGSVPCMVPLSSALCLAPFPCLGWPLLPVLAVRQYGASHEFMEGDWILQGPSA